MAIYAISLQPLISSDLKQRCYADDASGFGSLEAIKQWWEELTEAGPDLGYYPNAKKGWLITKPEKVEGARVIFEGTAIKISYSTDGYIFSEHSQILEPLERTITDVLIPSITDHHFTTPRERDLLALSDWAGLEL